MADGSQVPFSARIKAPRAAIDGDFPSSARVGLFHILQELDDRGYVNGWPAVARELQRIARVMPERYITSSVDSVKRARSDAQAELDGLPWEKVFDFCERLHSHLATELGSTDEY